MRKIMIFFVLSIYFCFVVSCKTDYSVLTTFPETNIYSQEESEYFVYLFRDNCGACETSKATVVKYLTQAEKKKDQMLMIYGVNLAVDGETQSLIYREYKGEGGQGTDGLFFVDNISLWGELYIGRVPALIKVKDVDGVKTSFYVTHGATAIKNYLQGLL